MKTNVVKIISIILMIAMVLTLGASIVNASYISPDDIQPQDSGATNAVKNISGQILGVVQIVAVAVAVIMLIVLAIKYITAAPNDKADIKKSATIYVVGAVILFAASGILGIIQGFAENAIQ